MTQAIAAAAAASDPLLSTATHDLTFRDPAGQLRLAQSHAWRRIHPGALEPTRAFLASPLRMQLERSGDLVPTEIARPDSQPFMQSDDLWLCHPRIEPISYPWEWTLGQWHAASELTLRIADQAIDAGWTLKDATPLNIVFDGPRPILVDVLSLERRDPRSSVWLAYGQFVRTFLLPLLGRKLLGWPLEATFFSRDGYEPRTLYRALSFWQRLHPDLLDIVTLATIFENRSGAPTGKARKSSSQPPELVVHILHKRIARLRKQIERATGKTESSQWSSYPSSATHYRASDTQEKEDFVCECLQHCRPTSVLDVGANTGVYSRLAAAAGARVVSLDSDTAALDALWRTAADAKVPITALVANIARPTPAAGWLNREQLSLLDRLTGNFDLVLMLAVIHHLILREQLPLAHIAQLCASLTRRWLILEWVPPSDPMYREWLHGREDLYGNFSERDLLRAFDPYFSVARLKILGNHRVLFLFECRAVSSESSDS